MNRLIPFVKRHFFTKRELKTYIGIAIPMVVSQSTDTLMMFTDRVFLSRYKENLGELYLNAGFTASLSSFFLCAFFIFTSSYTNALTSQYYGAGKYKHCAKVGAQSFYFALFSYPVLLLLLFIIPFIYRYFEHDPVQTALQIQYTTVILLGSILLVFRSGISGFFIGIGKSKIVMISNILGLLLNVPCNYALINGMGFLPEMGIVGAAIATITANAVSLLIQIVYYFSNKLNGQYQTRRQLRFAPGIFKKILKFGSPPGLEGLFGLGAFNYFILVMNSYGSVVGAAVSITINWDSMFFIPMLGAQFATTSLVGRYMGAKDVESAKRVVITSFTLMVLYSAVIITLFLSMNHVFINLFLTKMGNAGEVSPLATTMLKLACLYLVADAAHLSFEGALRGAGDTKVSMYIFVTITLIFAVLIYTFVENRLVSPIGAWLIFVGFAIALGLGMFLRYLQGKWKHINLIDN